MIDSGETFDEVRKQIFDDRVSVFTPEEEVLELSIGFTLVDCEYHIHSDVGHHCINAKTGDGIRVIYP